MGSVVSVDVRLMRDRFKGRLGSVVSVDARLMRDRFKVVGSRTESAQNRELLSDARLRRDRLVASRLLPDARLRRDRLVASSTELDQNRELLRVEVVRTHVSFDAY